MELSATDEKDFRWSRDGLTSVCGTTVLVDAAGKVKVGVDVDVDASGPDVAFAGGDDADDEDVDNEPNDDNRGKEFERTRNDGAGEWRV
jgi:hypothetical protein